MGTTLPADMAGVTPPVVNSAIPDLNEPYLVVDVDAARANIPADPTIPLPPGTKGAPQPEPDLYSPSATEQPPPIGPFPENNMEYLTIKDLLATDEKDDDFLHNIPRDNFAEAAFNINKELAKKNRLVRMMWGMRHLDTLEARTTRVQYLRALLDFRRWCCKELPRQQTARFKGGAVLEHEDEIWRYISDDMGDQWHTAKDDLLWMHGPRVNATRIKAYILSIVNRVHSAQRDCVDRHRGTLGDTYTTNQIRHLMFKVLPTWAARAYEPKAATPSQTLWKFLLMKTMTLLGHHTLLREASLRAIELSDLFLYRMGSASPEHSTRRPVVMVIASQNSKTNKDACLHHSYAARHLEQEMCAVGHTLLWLHFVYDQLNRSPTSRCVPPLDFSKCGDYHLGRSTVKLDDKVVALIAQHIFPWAEVELVKVSNSDGRNADNPPTISTPTFHRQLIVFVFLFDSQAINCASAREPNTAGVHFLQSLIEFGRRIVTDDLACMLMREPWHPYVQSSKLCRDPDFQKWAKDVNRVDPKTIATRCTTSENPQEEFSARVDAEHQVNQLTMMLHRQREDVAIEKLEMQKNLEKDAHIAKLMQALQLAEARPTPTAPAPSRPMTDAEKAAAIKIKKEQDDDLAYKVDVVHPWRTSKTVEAAWRWWNNPSHVDARPLRECYAEPRFLVRHKCMICKVEKADKPAASPKSAQSSRGRKAPTDDSPTTAVGESGKNDAL
ncbi:unnamed protein product [Closterium sp. NIES-64]|nr:unnamed protein product [Closterium sp. NIES-64]